MSRVVKAQGIECPMIREGDNVADIVVDRVLKETEILCGAKVPVVSLKSPDGVEYRQIWRINDKDVIGITESVIARAAGQYVTVDEIAEDIEKKFGKDVTICLISPIYSRNRFSLILKGIARAAKKVIIVMSEKDEVGNPREVNPFTGVDIEEYYKELCKSERCECVVTTPPVFNCNDFIYCGLHDYTRWNDVIRFNRLGINHGKDPIHFTLADICSGKSPDWGLLGTNKATEEKLKLFPSIAECQRVCESVKAKIKEKTGKDVIVCVYGDGCFKDPVGGIWEFADPTTMPYCTDKEIIESTPYEIKLKSFIDCGFDEKGLNNLINFTHNNQDIAEKHKSTEGAIGTTPRVYRDSLASLMDQISGSGDRATPVVLVQNYF